MKVIPDSSFFICFIDDLEDFLPFDDRIQILGKISGYYTVIIGPEVSGESPLHRLPDYINDQFLQRNPREWDSDPDPSVELLRPLLGKGEFEVITCSIFYLKAGKDDFLLILDDGIARDLVQRTQPHLWQYIKGTVGFLGDCVVRKILEKNSVIQLLTVLPRTKFRVDPSIIRTVMTDINNRCP